MLIFSRKLIIQNIRDDLSKIAGKFKVVRQETAATKMDLRDVVFIDLERQLKEMGVDFSFPKHGRSLI